MDPLSLVLVVVGAVLVVVAALRMRGPLATIRRLDATQANLERYESWRGKQTGVQAEGPTGADEMRAMMRRQLIAWGAIAAVGVALVLAGWALG